MTSTARACVALGSAVAGPAVVGLAWSTGHVLLGIASGTVLGAYWLAETLWWEWQLRAADRTGEAP